MEPPAVRAGYGDTADRLERALEDLQAARAAWDTLLVGQSH